MKRKIKIVLCTVGLAVLLGCQGQTETPVPTATNTPTPTNTPLLAGTLTPTSIPTPTSTPSDVEATDKALSNVMKPVERKYIFISDSYGVITNANNKNWVTLVCETLNIPTSNYYDIHYGGAGFSIDGDANFLTMLQNSNITNKNEITDIIVGGGANDTLNDYDTNISKIGEFMTYVNENFPNATVSLAHFGIQIHSSVTINRYKNSLSAWRDVGMFGGKYILNSEYILYQISLFDTDLLHPTQMGVEVLASHMCGALVNGYCNVNRMINPTLTLATQDTSLVSGILTNNTGVYMNLVNSSVHLSSNGVGLLGTLNFASPITLSANATWVDLFALSDSLFIGGTGLNKTFNGCLDIVKQDLTTYCIPCTYYVSEYTGGNLTIGLVYYNHEEVQNVIQINFLMGSATFHNEF